VVVTAMMTLSLLVILFYIIFVLYLFCFLKYVASIVVGLRIGVFPPVLVGGGCGCF
jgi:hypothetical protein